MSHTAFATICHKIEVCHSKRWIFTEEIGLKTPYLHTNRITQCDNLNSVKKSICKFQKTKKIKNTRARGGEGKPESQHSTPRKK